MNSLGKIVVVRLEYNKYFISYTDIKEVTLESLDLDLENIWFRAFCPIEIIDVFDSVDSIDHYTIQYMEKYGISNVRSKEYLSDSISLEKHIHKSILEKMLGPLGEKVYKDIENEYHFGANDSLWDHSRPAISSVNDKYKNKSFLDIDYYDTTGKCEVCFGKEAHREGCLYIHIRSLPK